jgi:hypothetical protein
MKNTTLKINQTVRNFGILAKVDGFHETTGDPILRDFYNNGERWVADHRFCEPVEYAETLIHKNALA